MAIVDINIRLKDWDENNITLEYKGHDFRIHTYEGRSNPDILNTDIYRLDSGGTRLENVELLDLLTRIYSEALDEKMRGGNDNAQE